MIPAGDGNGPCSDSVLATKSRFSLNEARFDSPGRVSPGNASPMTPKPQRGARFQDSKVVHAVLESRPFRANPIFLSHYPGLTRPGLSNLAPLGLLSSQPNQKSDAI